MNVLSLVANLPGSARVSRVGFGVPPKRTFLLRTRLAQEEADAETGRRSPARETRALPRRRMGRASIEMR